jgi:AmpE protein
MATALLAVLVSIVLSHSLPELGGCALRLVRKLAARRLQSLAGSGIWAGRHGGWWSIGVPVALLALLQFLLWGQAYGFPSFLLATLLLFYCWGPRDLDADIGAVTHAADRDARVAALQEIPSDPPVPPLALDGRTLVDTVFRAALTRWFGVLFWFLLLGAAAHCCIDWCNWWRRPKPPQRAAASTCRCAARAACPA